MEYKSSFSQHSRFELCKRMWFYEKILKLPAIQDMSYAYAGNVLHKSLEKFYNNDFKDITEAKDFFRKQWLEKELDISKIKNFYDEYILMLINGAQLSKKPTSTEIKIYYPDVIGYLDAVNINDDEIWDYKSSKRIEENEKEYIKQMKLYSWLYYRKFNRLPKKCTVFYLRYSGSKGELVYIPNDKDIFKIEDWYIKILSEMKQIIINKKLPEKCKECNPYCPYVNYCEENENCLKYTLHINGNYIFLEGVMTDLLNKGLDKKFSYELKNAFFIKKANPYVNTDIKFWNAKKRLLPLGFYYGLIKTLEDYAKHKGKELILDIKDNRTFNEKKVDMPDNFLNGVKLRDYQDEAVMEFLRKRIGILEVGTGGGKTLIATEIIRRLGIKTLFVVDKIELLRQTKKVLEESLGIEIGQIGGGEEDIRDITVATVQTLVKRLNQYSKYLSKINFVIFDECHKTAARSYYKISQYLVNTEYRLGLSGTAYRDDGNDMMINATTGYKIYDLSSKILIGKGWLIRPNIIFIKDYLTKKQIERMESECKTGLINESQKYTTYYSRFISDNEIRDDKILYIVEHNKNKKILILTKLIEHGQRLTELIPNAKHLYGATSKEDRKKMFNEFTNDKLNVLVSTISIFAEGIDIPQLDMVINASANKGDVKSIQVLGRVLRKLEGKKNAYYIDFIDETRFFRLASLSRRRAFRKEGHDVETVDWQKFTESQHLNSDVK